VVHAFEQHEKHAKQRAARRHAHGLAEQID
jgi:hypothetical protein